MDGVRGRGRLKVPARASLWYIASSAVARSISVVGTPIFTRLLTPAEYGVFPHYMTYFSLFSAIATLELSGSVILRGMQRFANGRDRLVSGAVGLCGLCWAVFSLGYFGLSLAVGDISGLGGTMTAVLLVHVLFNAIISIYTARLRYEYKYRAVAAVNLASAFLSPILAITLISVTNAGGSARPYAAAVSAAVIAIPFLIIILRRSGRFYDGEVWKFLLKFNLPLLPHYLSAALILRIGEVVLSRVHGSAALAKYSVAMSVGLSLTVITNGMLSALSPWMLRRVEAGEIGESRSLLWLATRLLTLLCLLVLAVAPEMIRIVCPPEYHDALFAVYPLALSVIPTFLSNAIASGEMYFERSAVTSVPTVISAVLCVGLTLLLIPYTDYRLTAVLLLAAYLVMCALNCVLFRRLSGQRPLYYGRTALLLVGAVVYAGLIFLLRDSFAARVALALPLIVLLIPVGRALYEKVKENG